MVSSADRRINPVVGTQRFSKPAPWVEVYSDMWVLELAQGCLVMCPWGHKKEGESRDGWALTFIPEGNVESFRSL